MHRPSSLPIWSRPDVLHGRQPKHRTWDNALGIVPPQGAIDRRGMLLATCDKLGGNPAYSLDWLADNLNLGKDGDWPALRYSCAEFAGRFFCCPGRTGAWIHFESCRDPVAVQSPRLIQRPVCADLDRQPLASGRPGLYTFRSADPRSPDVSFDLSAMRFVDREGYVSRKVARSTRDRTIFLTNAQLYGVFDAWCAADPVDDRADIERGAIPALDRFRRPNGITETIMVNWVRLAGNHYDAMTLELAPGSAALLSVRRTRVPLELILRNHPRYEHWIRTILGETDVLPLPELPSGIDPVIFERSRDLLKRPRSRIDYETKFRLLVEYVRPGEPNAPRSLRRAAASLGFDRHAAVNHLNRLQKALGVPLYVSRRGGGGQNSSEPTEYAVQLAAWLANAFAIEP